MLAGAGVDLAPGDVDRLVARTEGWPAGLYLAALAMNAGSPHLAAASSVTGTERFIAEYLRSEFLDRVSRSDVLFLTRASILDRMCGPLCDQTVGRTGSSRVLHRLEQRNLLVIPMDRDGEWYRYHHLFRELLHGELMRREPETIGDLHLRRRVVVRSEPPARGGHRTCPARRRRRGRRSTRSRARESSLGKWAPGHGAALDAVVRGAELIEEQPARCGSRSADPGPRGQRDRRGALGQRSTAHDANGDGLGREHDWKARSRISGR